MKTSGINCIELINCCQYGCKDLFRLYYDGYQALMLLCTFTVVLAKKMQKAKYIHV